MGIYTDYGRFQKAREFKDYCNSGAGVWFAFSMGSPRWDKLIHKTIDGVTTDVLNVPPSQPSSYTPLYRWFESYKGSDLQVQEFSLIDRSFCDSCPSTGTTGYTTGTFPTNSVIENNKDVLPPQDSNGNEGEYTPSVCLLDQSRVASATNNALNTSNSIEQYSWNTDPTKINSLFYPTPSLPAFPVSYTQDWKTIIDEAKSNLVSGGNLFLYYMPGATSTNDSWQEPNDSTKFESWSYLYHLSQTRTNSSNQSPNKISSCRPLGLYSFIKGQARFVEPVSEEMAQESTISTFKYGSHYWRIVPDANITADNLPHHILLTVSVFPNELSDSSIVERYLPVRQVSVFKFPDCILEQIPELEQSNPSRRYQVLKRDRFNIIRGNDTYPDISTVKDVAWEDGRQIYLPFYFDDPAYTDPDYPDQYKNPYLSPNPPNKIVGGVESIRLRGTIEMLINDYMTARTRDVQQTDRYGYIIGF